MIIAGYFASIAAALFLVGYIYDFGWRRGRMAGLEEGRRQGQTLKAQDLAEAIGRNRDTAQWIVAAEIGIEAARREIRREEESA